MATMKRFDSNVMYAYRRHWAATLLATKRKLKLRRLATIESYRGALRLPNDLFTHAPPPCPLIREQLEEFMPKHNRRARTIIWLLATELEYIDPTIGAIYFRDLDDKPRLAFMDRNSLTLL